MRQYMAFAWICLILLIINFARTAPIVVRRAHEVHVNVVDVAEDGSATSQKRWDSGSRDDWLATAADQTNAPTTPMPSTRLNNLLSSLALSTGPHPRSKDGDSSPPSASAPISSPIPWGPDQAFTPSPEYSPIQWGPEQAFTSSPEYSPIPWVPDKPSESSSDFSWPSRLSPDNSLLSIPDNALLSSTDNPHSSNPEHFGLSLLSADTGNSHPMASSPDDSWMNWLSADIGNSHPMASSPDDSWANWLSADIDNSHPMASNPDFSWASWLSADKSLPPSPETSLPSSSHPSSPDHSPISIDYSPPSTWTLSPKYSPPSSWSTDYSPPSSPSTDHSPVSIDYSPPNSLSPKYPPPSSSSTDHPPPSPLSSTAWSPTGPHQSTDDYPPTKLEPPNTAVSESESESEDFLDKLLRGKIRRRISGFGGVKLAQNEV